MKTIKIMSVSNDIRTLYKRANTHAQRALLGYMAKAGVISDPIFGGAFNLLRSIEWCMRENVIYNLYPLEDSDTTRKIIHIAQLALNGDFNSLAFTAKEIENIVKCMNEF